MRGVVSCTECGNVKVSLIRSCKTCEPTSPEVFYSERSRNGLYCFASRSWTRDAGHPTNGGWNIRDKFDIRHWGLRGLEKTTWIWNVIKNQLYRWVSYKKTIRSAGYFFIETLFHWKFCRQNKFHFTMFSLSCGQLHFPTRIFNFLVSTFWHLEHLVPRRFVVGMFWRCNVLPPKNKNLPFLYETRPKLSYEFSCRNFFYRRLTCRHLVNFWTVVLCDL